MPRNLSRRQAVAALSIGCAMPSMLPSFARSDELQTSSSDYGLQYQHNEDDLIGDLLHGERGDPRRQSETPHEEWYSHRIREKFGSWGPASRHYLRLPGLEGRPVEWKRERVIATAARFIGYGYQHHHIPDWDPPADWTWSKTCVGSNGRGFDCSNFTSFVYNQGFGIHMNSGIERQASASEAAEGRERSVRLQRIEIPADYAQRQEVLRTGDLVYVRGREDGPITHVILWVGAVGRSGSGVPLIMDSHGGGVNDDEGRPIPCGVHLRPFREKSWYNRCASHAHRVFG